MDIAEANATLRDCETRLNDIVSEIRNVVEAEIAGDKLDRTLTDIANSIESASMDLSGEEIEEGEEEDAD